MYTVKVTLSHATKLPASDYNGKSDPYVRFLVDGKEARSSCRNASCDPVWSPHETFEFKINNPQDQFLVVEVYDYDLISKDDILGTLSLPLRHHVVDEETPENSTPCAYTLEPAAAFQSQGFESQIHLAVRVVPLDGADQVLEVWENQTWSMGKGWVSSESGGLLGRRARWSTEDGKDSSETFDKVAPKVPEGYVGAGWSYCVGNGDREGWYYAKGFAGPWYGEKSTLSVVRRRRWENQCTREDKQEGRQSLQF
ncbi:hypothetical protein Poli38472_008671 [Pythium oligandrum]|uniref:C2 domain-containing protein n=1 Tax=Pythium oligandrum TaxID=41045 RepID=A0A8K1FEN5_PYTOL|nr:hypothetical protein Poli38472_008671 [Pythium oligandrum]|eukprot:TMW56023.1 hypothetical protein Poli38472_008671 [Pythium oligandrum]